MKSTKSVLRVLLASTLLVGLLAAGSPVSAETSVSDSPTTSVDVPTTDAAVTDVADEEFGDDPVAEGCLWWQYWC